MAGNSQRRGARRSRQIGDKQRGQPLDAEGAAEGRRIRQGQNIRQRFEAAVQRFLEQDPFSRNQAELRGGGVHGSDEHRRRTGFRQEAEDLTFVDRGNRRIQIGLKYLF